MYEQAVAFLFDLPLLDCASTGLGTSCWKQTGEVVLEVELGADLLRVHAQPDNRTQYTVNQQSSNILLRSLVCKSTVTVHCSTKNGSIPVSPHSWAPQQIRKLVQQIEACCAFESPTVILGAISSCRVYANDQQTYTWAHRKSVRYSADIRKLGDCTDMKVKQTYQICGLSLQVANETADPQSTGFSCGIPNVCASFIQKSSADSMLVKVEWISHISTFFVFMLRLSFISRMPVSELEKRIQSLPVPSSEQELQVWIGVLGSQYATWRIETEVVEPVSARAIAMAMFAHKCVTSDIQVAGLSSDTSDDILPDLPTVFGMITKEAITTRVFHGIGNWEQLSGPLMQLARRHLSILCRRYALRESAGYPVIPRPRDLLCTDRHLVHGDMWVTPKSDGRECVIWSNRFGVYMLTRTGDWSAWTWDKLIYKSRLYPILLEAEAWGVGTASVQACVYDCLASPILCYTYGMSFSVRQLALRSLVQALGLRDGPLKLSYKPAFCLTSDPYQSLEKCLRWAEIVMHPCDGVILYNNHDMDYVTSCMYKVKRIITIDLLAMPVLVDNDHCWYEIMARIPFSQGGGFRNIQHISCSKTGSVYELPVLLHCPDPGVSGRVVEFALSKTHETLEPLCLREKGKTANIYDNVVCTVTSGVTLGDLQAPTNGMTLKFCIAGALRPKIRDLLQNAFAAIGNCYALDIGGGRGGTMSIWAKLAPVVLHVFEPDIEARSEYINRLNGKAEVRNEENGCISAVLFSTTRHRGFPLYLHPVSLQDSVHLPTVGANFIYLGFSLSQIVTGGEHLISMFEHICYHADYPVRIFAIFHDHSRTIQHELQAWRNAEFCQGVKIILNEQEHTGYCWCGENLKNGSTYHQWVCTCTAVAAHQWKSRKLTTTISGSNMMQRGVVEYAMDTKIIYETLTLPVIMRNLRISSVHMDFPFSHLGEQCHWLLRTLCAMTIDIV